LFNEWFEEKPALLCVDAFLRPMPGAKHVSRSDWLIPGSLLRSARPPFIN
jgi:hypothetical protein